MPDVLGTLEGVIFPPIPYCDIEALYSSIPHDECIQVMSKIFNEQEQSSWPLNIFILNSLNKSLPEMFYIYVYLLPLGARG